MIRVILSTIVVALALVFVTGALAGKPPAYAGKAGGTQAVVQKGAQGVQGTKTVGNLPFTGANLAVFAAGAAGLLITGFSFRRLGRRNS